MHELSIAQNVVDIIHQHIQHDEIADVRTVRVLVGAASGVVPDSLTFSYQAIVSETPLSSSRMDIEQIPFRITCLSCLMISENDAGLRMCPLCGSSDTKILSGTELWVKDIELGRAGEEIA